MASSSVAAAAWSVDSLPEYASGWGEDTTEQELVAESLSDLSDITQELGIILTAEETNSVALRRLNFVAVTYLRHFTMDELQSYACPPRARALLVVHLGITMEESVLQGINALSRNASAPAILAVLITNTGEDQGAGVVLPEELARARATCLESGADDVITLRQGEVLSGHHVLESINRAEIQAQKMSELEMEASEIHEQATNEVNATKEMLQRKLQVAWKKMMWHLPGRLLESIPGEDSSLQEQLNPDGGVATVGEYTFAERLGRGADGTVFKATDAVGTFVAVKVIHKSNLKKVSKLLSLEQEMCLMQHLPPHPNVIRARAALHGTKNLYLIMEYTGSMDLHRFVQARVSRTGASALEADLASCFIPQMVAAVAHLHRMAICHRDLKSENFIVSDSGEGLSLGDFGLAAMLCSPMQRLTQCCGSLPFVAPEVLQQQVGGQSYDPFAADIWSLAMNFVEIRKGPYIVEKILGWVPQHPTDPLQRIEGMQRFPALLASHSDAGMMGGIVTQMLRLRPEDRLTISEVLGPGGLGYDDAPAAPPAPQGASLSTAAVGREIALGPGALCSRTVDVEGEDLKGTLLERLGGATAIRVAVDNMFDLAITNTPLALLLDFAMGGMPAVRSLYADEVAEYFDCDRVSTRAQASVGRMREAHMHLTMSDSDFDVLSEHFAAALVGNGVCEAVVRQARARFGELRDAVTANFHMGAAHARRCGTAGWRAAAAADGEGRVQRFAEVLAGLLAQHPGIASGRMDGRTGVLPALSADSIRGHFLRYLRGEEGMRSPVALQGLQLGLRQVAVVVNNARTAFVQAGWRPEEVCILYFSLREGWDRVRLVRRLRKLQNAFLSSDIASWTAIMLSVHQAAQCCRLLAETCRQDAFVPFLSIVGAVLADGTWEDKEESLTNLGRSLDLPNAAFDALAELFRSACARILPKVESQVFMIVLAIRPWIMLIDEGTNQA